MNVAEIFEKMPYGPAPESKAAAEQWLDDHERRFGLFINNRFVAPISDAYAETHDPATGALLGQVAVAGDVDVAAAVKAARTAFKSWRETPDHERARYLYAIARQILGRLRA